MNRKANSVVHRKKAFSANFMFNSHYSNVSANLYSRHCSQLLLPVFSEQLGAVTSRSCTTRLFIRIGSQLVKESMEN